MASQGAACARPVAASRPAPASSAAAAASRALSVLGQAPGAAGGARCAPGPAAGGSSCVGSAHCVRAAQRAGRALARRSGALTCSPRQTLGKAWAGGRPLGALDDIRQNRAQAATCKGGGRRPPARPASPASGAGTRSARAEGRACMHRSAASAASRPASAAASCLRARRDALSALPGRCQAEGRVRFYPLP